MKTTLFSIFLTLLLVLTFCLPSPFAEDYTTWNLPEGAKARLRKGVVSGNVEYSPDGTLLAVGTDIGIWLYDTATYREVSLLQDPLIYAPLGYSVRFSPDGKTLVRAGAGIQLWDIATGQPVGAFTKRGGATIQSVHFNPDGTTLATGGTDGTVRLWDVKTGTETRVLTGHSRWVTSVAFSPDGSTLASGSWDKTVRLWHATTGAHTFTLNGHTDLIDGVVFSPDGTILASGSQDGTVLLWDISSFEPVPSAEDINADGVVNIQDLVLVASNLGETGENPADVNADGVVNIQDLVLVAAEFNNNAAAPSTWGNDLAFAPTRAEVEQWLTQAQQLNLTDAASQRGIRFLEQLLLALTPKETALLPNYPNPFNPET